MTSSPLPFGVFYGVRYPCEMAPKHVLQNYALCKLCREPFLLDSSGSEVCGRLGCYLDQLFRSRNFVSRVANYQHSKSLLVPDPSSLAWWAASKLQEEEDRKIIRQLGLPVQSQIAQVRLREVRELGRISRRRSRGRGHQATGGRRMV